MVKVNNKDTRRTPRVFCITIFDFDSIFLVFHTRRCTILKSIEIRGNSSIKHVDLLSKIDNNNTRTHSTHYSCSSIAKFGSLPTGLLIKRYKTFTKLNDKKNTLMLGNLLKITGNNVCNTELSFTLSPVTLFSEKYWKILYIIFIIS